MKRYKDRDQNENNLKIEGLNVYFINIRRKVNTT